jgi:hypothetical protein
MFLCDEFRQNSFFLVSHRMLTEVVFQQHLQNIQDFNENGRKSDEMLVFMKSVLHHGNVSLLYGTVLSLQDHLATLICFIFFFMHIVFAICQIMLVSVVMIPRSSQCYIIHFVKR